MVYLVAASSLHRTLNDLESEEKKVFSISVTTVPGLSLNPNRNNREKNLQVVLDKDPLHSIEDIVVWHDIISISISCHRSNNYRPASPEDFFKDEKYTNQSDSVL